MTMSYTPSKAVFNGNGVAVDFPFSFKVWKPAQLEVTISDPDGVARVATGWTVSLQNGGGTVTYRKDGAPLPAGWKLAIVRAMPFEQDVDLVNGTMFHAEVVEDQMDKATAERQQLKEAVDRSIKVPPTSENPPELLADMIFEARDQSAASAAAAAISEAAAAASAAAAAVSESATALTLETAVAVIGEEKANALDSIEAKRLGVMNEVTAEHNAALADIATGRSESVGSISSLATEKLTAITREGQLQQNAVAAAGAGIVATGKDVVNQVIAEGTVQAGRVTATGNKARVDLVLEGDAQVNRVATTGAEYVKQTHEEALLARGEADRAEAAADKAVSIAGMDIASATNIGLCPKVGEGLKVVTLPDGSKRMDAITQVIAVSTPELTFPADVAAGFEYTLSMSAGTLIPGGRVTGYEVTVDGGTAIDIVANSEGIGTAVITPAGVDLTTGNIAVLAIDSEGNRSKIAYRTFTKHAVVVRAPHVLSPLEGDTDVALLAQFQVQSFDIYGMAAVGVATQLQIATDRDFAHVVYDSGENHAYATTFAMTDRLPDDCTLYARARHKADMYGWSAYGSVVGFTTIAKGIAKPRIIAPIAGAVDQPVNVAVVLSPIEVSGISATPAHTRVIVALDESLTNRVFDSGESAAYSTSVATNNLPVNTLLHVSGQHKDAELGWSPLADISTFTTLNAYTVKPAITAPTAVVNMELRPTFVFSAFANIGPVDTLKQRIFQVARDALFTDLIVNATLAGASAGQYAMQADLPLFSDFYARVQDEGNTWGVSEWSTVYSFKTLNAYVEKPAITFPAQGATGVSIRPTFTATAFANTGPTDTPAGGHWRLARDAAFTDIVEEANGNYATSFTPLQNLDITKDYWVDVLYRGGLWGASQRADAVKFTTLTAFIHAPTFTGITEGQTGVALVPQITIGAFAVTPAGFDAPKAADNFWYEFRSSATVVASGHKTLPASGGIVSPSTPLPLDSNVTFTGKWVGSKLTGASKSVGFKTTKAYIEKPVIVQPVAGGQLRTANAQVVCSPSVAVGCTHVSTDWKLTSDEAGNNVIVEALGSSDKLAHVFANIPSSAYDKTAYCWARFNSNVAGISSDWNDAIGGTMVKQSCFVVVGDEGITTTSATGDAFTSPVYASDFSLHDVTYGDGKFVAVGEKSIISASIDGVNWEPSATIDTNSYLRVAYGKGMFVAVRSDGYVSTSTDRITWTPAIYLARECQPGGIAYGNGMFVVALYGGMTSDFIMLFSSTDAISWTGRSIANYSPAYGQVHDVTYGNDNFIVLGSGGKVIMSTDGINWTHVASIDSGSPSAVTYGDGKFVAVGASSVTSTSIDGINWNRNPSIPGNEIEILDVTYGDGKFVAVGISTPGSINSCWNSINGISWTNVSHNLGYIDSRIRKITYA